MWFGNGTRPQNNLAGYSRSFGSVQTGVHRTTDITQTMSDMQKQIDWMSVLIGAVGACLVWSLMKKK